MKFRYFIVIVVFVKYISPEVAVFDWYYKLSHKLWAWTGYWDEDQTGGVRTLTAGLGMGLADSGYRTGGLCRRCSIKDWCCRPRLSKYLSMDSGHNCKSLACSWGLVGEL